MIGLRFGTLLCLGALLLPAQELRDYERKVTEFTLSNGLHFILLERHQVPVVSFHTYVNAGSVEDPAGRTGLASLIARLAFDGTEAVGSKNWPAEKKAMEEVEVAFDRADEERNRGSKSALGAIADLQVAQSTALSAAIQLQNPGEYLRAIQENGGVGLDSHATPDSIETSYSLPSNRIELWFALESQRLAHPVFRNFYRERLKLAADSSNLMEPKSPGKVRQALLSTAFEDMPYRNPVLGWPGDVNNLRPADAKAFFETYCGPANTVISIVGDVDPANAQRLAERYFGSIPSRPQPPLLRTLEIPQAGPKSIAVWSDAPAMLTVGYKRPAETHRDDAALDVIAMILGDGQTGWLHKELVEDKQLALGVEIVPSFPSSHWVNLFLVSVIPARDHSVEENRKVVDDILARFESRPVDAETLARVKNVLRGRLVRPLGSNQQLAALLTNVFATYGDWRKLFTLAGEYNKLTAEDLQRVAMQYLVPVGRTVAYRTVQPVPGGTTANAGGVQ